MIKSYSGVKPEPIICTGEGFVKDPHNCAMFYRCMKSGNNKYTIFRVSYTMNVQLEKKPQYSFRHCTQIFRLYLLPIFFSSNVGPGLFTTQIMRCVIIPNPQRDLNAVVFLHLLHTLLILMTFRTICIMKYPLRW